MSWRWWLVVGACISSVACVAPAVTPTPTPTRLPASSFLQLPQFTRPQPTPATTPRPTVPARPTADPARPAQPTASPGPAPAVLIAAASPVAGQRAFAAAYSAASATRRQAATLLDGMFDTPPLAGHVAAHEEVCLRYLDLVQRIAVPPTMLSGLRALQERAEQDVAAQRLARATVQQYWISQQPEDMALARQAREKARMANEEALRAAQALGAALP